MSCECTDHYVANVTCTNCQYNGSINIKKGTKVADESCPNCGCKTLANNLPVITSTPWTYQPYIYYDGTGKQVFPGQPPTIYCKA